MNYVRNNWGKLLIVVFLSIGIWWAYSAHQQGKFAKWFSSKETTQVATVTDPESDKLKSELAELRKELEATKSGNSTTVVVEKSDKNIEESKPKSEKSDDGKGEESSDVSKPEKSDKGEIIPVAAVEKTEADLDEELLAKARARRANELENLRKGTIGDQVLANLDREVAFLDQNLHGLDGSAFAKANGPVVFAGTGFNTLNHPIVWFQHPLDPNVYLPAQKESYEKLKSSGGNGMPAIICQPREDGVRSMPPFEILGAVGSNYEWRILPPELVTTGYANTHRDTLRQVQFVREDLKGIKNITSMETWGIVLKKGGTSQNLEGQPANEAARSQAQAPQPGQAPRAQPAQASSASGRFGHQPQPASATRR